MIQVSAIGRIGTDGVMRQAGQSSVVGFSMAVEKTTKGQDGKLQVDWYSVDVWGKQGETLCQYLKKGTQVAVFGRLEIQNFTKQDGTSASKPVINANQVKLLARPNNQQQGAPVQQQLPVGQPQQSAPPPVVPQGQPTQADLDAIFGSEEIPF